MLPSPLCHSALTKLGLNPNTQSSSSNWTSGWMPASSVLSGFIYGSIMGAVYETALNVYPLKLNTHTWNTEKPALLLENQLMLDEKAPQRPADSALVAPTSGSTVGPESAGGCVIRRIRPRENLPRVISLQRTALLANEQVTHTHTHPGILNSPCCSVLLIIPINSSANTEGTTGVLFPSLELELFCV